MLDWGPIVVSLIAAIVSIGGLLMQRRKDTATVAEAYEAMATRQAEEIAKLRPRCVNCGMKWSVKSFTLSA